MSTRSSRGSPPSWWMRAVVSALPLLPGCVGTPSSFCPPDKLTHPPEARLLTPCRQAVCLLPDSFDGSSLTDQASQVEACHEERVKAYLACAAKDRELVEWVQHRVEEQVK